VAEHRKMPCLDDKAVVGGPAGPAMAGPLFLLSL